MAQVCSEEVTKPQKAYRTRNDRDDIQGLLGVLGHERALQLDLAAALHKRLRITALKRARNDIRNERQRCDAMYIALRV